MKNIIFKNTSLRAVFCGCALLVLNACTSTQVSTSYYNIQGNTPDQLDRQLRQKGPANGHALASAAIRFKPVSIKTLKKSRGNTEVCRVSVAQIQVVARVTLPRWMNRQGASRDLKNAFNNLADYAKEHEATHVRIADKWARNMEKALLKLPAQKTCSAVEKRIDRTIRQFLKKHDAEQKRFDRDEQRRLSRLLS